MGEQRVGDEQVVRVEVDAVGADHDVIGSMASENPKPILATTEIDVELDPRERSARQLEVGSVVARGAGDPDCRGVGDGRSATLLAGHSNVPGRVERQAGGVRRTKNDPDSLCLSVVGTRVGGERRGRVQTPSQRYHQADNHSSD